MLICKIFLLIIYNNKCLWYYFDIAYPVGSIYISTSDTDPATTLGGEWESYGKGRILIGAGTDDDGDTNGEQIMFSSGDTGGEYKHSITKAELPNLYGSFRLNVGVPHDGNGWTSVGSNNTGMSTVIHSSGNTRNSLNDNIVSYSNKPIGVQFNFGSNEAHNNLQPYIVTYMWKRVS